MIRTVADSYRDARAREPATPIAIAGRSRITSPSINATIRWVEKARARGGADCTWRRCQDFAARAYRRPLTPAERDDLLGVLPLAARDRDCDHEDAMRDCDRQRADVAGLLLPHRSRCRQRSDVAPAVHAAVRLRAGQPVELFPVVEHARRRSCWRARPAGDLHQPEVLAAQARRMLKDPRVRGLADRVRRQLARLPPLRRAQRRRSRALPQLRQRAARGDVRGADPLHARRRSRTIARSSTFSTPTTRSSTRRWRSTTACRDPAGGPDDWVRVDDADKYGRGGLLPMAVFLTKNAPGLRTSPVKRGYWVVKTRARRADSAAAGGGAGAAARRGQAGPAAARRCWPSIARTRAAPSCHARFDSLGLVFEGYGPIGERRDEGSERARRSTRRPTFPGGSDGDRRRRPARLHPRSTGRTISSTTCRASCWRTRSAAA